MSDAAETWLRENDPSYARTSFAWKHITSGEYLAPWQEVPVGGVDDVARIASEREARGRVSREGSHKLCASCEDRFAPLRVGHVYCSDRCATRERVRRHRARL